MRYGLMRMLLFLKETVLTLFRISSVNNIQLDTDHIDQPLSVYPSGPNFKHFDPIVFLNRKEAWEFVIIKN